METLKLEVNQQQLEVINVALHELPYKIAAPVIAFIHSETVKQLREFEDTTIEN